MCEHVTGGYGIKAKVAVHTATVDTRMQRTGPALHHAMAIVPWREPIGFTRTEDCHHRFAQGGGKMGRKLVVAEHRVGVRQHTDEGQKIGCFYFARILRGHGLGPLRKHLDQFEFLRDPI